MRRFRAIGSRVLAAGAVALLLSGCIKLNMDLTVSSNNTMSGSAIIAINKQLLSLTGQTPDQIFGQDTIVPAGTIGVATSAYEDDTFVGQKVTFENTPLSTLNASQDPDALKIVRDGDVFRVTGALDLSNTGSDSQQAQFAEQALRTADIRVSISFPGDVVSSNGTVEGKTVTWAPKMGTRTELQAVAGAIGSGSTLPVVWIVVGVAALLVVGGGVVLMGRRKASQTPDADQATLVEPSAEAEAPVSGTPEMPIPSSQPDPPAEV